MIPSTPPDRISPPSPSLEREQRGTPSRSSCVSREGEAAIKRHLESRRSVSCSSHKRARRSLFDGDEAAKGLIESVAQSQLKPLDPSADQGLERALLSGNEKEALFFLQQGGNPFLQFTAAKFNGQQPIHVAASQGLMQVLKALLQGSVLPSVQDSEDRSPLHHAAANGRRAAIELLLEMGATAWCLNKDLQTPLYSAIAGGHEACALLLIDHTPVSYFERINGWVSSAIHQASCLGQESILEKLLEKGFSVDFVNQRVEDRAPLHFAAQKNQVQLISWLLAKGAKLDICDAKQQSPLHLALYHRSEEAACLLLDKGAPQDADALEIALLKGVSGALKHFSPHLVNTFDSKGLPPLHRLIVDFSDDPTDRTEAVKWLLDHGADLHFLDQQETTALQSALLKKMEGVASLLISQGASLVDSEGRDQLQPLFLAISNFRQVPSDRQPFWLKLIHQMLTSLNSHQGVPQNLLWYLFDNQVPLKQWLEVLGSCSEKPPLLNALRDKKALWTEILKTEEKSLAQEVFQALGFKIDYLQRAVLILEVQQCVWAKTLLPKELEEQFFQMSEVSFEASFFKEASNVNYFYDNYRQQMQELATRPLNTLNELYLLPFLSPEKIRQVVSDVSFADGHTLMSEKIMQEEKLTLSSVIFERALSFIFEEGEEENVGKMLASIHPAVCALATQISPIIEHMDGNLLPLLEKMNPPSLACLIPTLNEEQWLKLLQMELPEHYMKYATAEQKKLLF
ncbi:MAG: Pfs, and Ankyrin domain protein [Chlamydiales bacterium]|jgi:ankyrin repeat protein|nr:Pfs, and Ankyrin domain protein [Chlamydiales bacterium]